MKLLDYLTPTKTVIYHTPLLLHEVRQSLESKISPKPQRKSIFSSIPLTYHGKITDNTFEIGRRSRGNKDQPPTAQGMIEEKQDGSYIVVNIIPSEMNKQGMTLIALVLVGLLIFILSLFINGDTESALGFSFFLAFFSFGFLINYLALMSANTTLSKDIQLFIHGQIIKKA